MEYHVYIVECADGTLYTGIATDVARRLREHNGQGQGGAKYTRTRQPVRLVYAESATTRSDALKREHAIRQMSRTAKAEMIAAAMRTRRVRGRKL